MNRYGNRDLLQLEKFPLVRLARVVGARTYLQLEAFPVVRLASAKVTDSFTSPLSELHSFIKGCRPSVYKYKTSLKIYTDFYSFSNYASFIQ
jgi:hypothetical protein